MVSSGGPNCTPRHLPCKAVVRTKHGHACELKRGVGHKGDTRGWPRSVLHAASFLSPLRSPCRAQSSRHRCPRLPCMASRGPGTRCGHSSLGRTGLPRTARRRGTHARQAPRTRPWPAPQPGCGIPPGPPSVPAGCSPSCPGLRAWLCRKTGSRVITTSAGISVPEKARSLPTSVPRLPYRHRSFSL